LKISGEMFKDLASKLIPVYFGEEENIPLGGGIDLFIKQGAEAYIVLEIRRIEREEEDLREEYDEVIQDLTTPAYAVTPNMSFPSFETYIDELSVDEKTTVELEAHDTEVEGNDFSIEIQPVFDE